MVTYGSMSERIVISGVGVVSPLGATVDAFRDGLLAGRSAIAPIQRFDVSACRTQRGASVTGFEPTQWIPPMKLRRMDDTARYAVVATRLAFESARYPLPEGGDDGAGVVLGTFTAGGQATSEYLEALYKGGPTGAPALLFNSTVGNAPASLAGLEFKLRGPNVTVSQKESSGLAAIVTAVDALRFGRAAALAAGGVDAIFDIFFRVHDRFGVMSTAPSPAGPFDAARDGFVLGEGGYALVLERHDSWIRRKGADAGGEVLGVGAGSAAVGINQWPDEPAAIARTVTAALDNAGLAADDIDVVYASANGSGVLDRVEAAALAAVFSGRRPIVTSIKGALGECGASGAAACAAALVCGRAGKVPPIAGLSRPDATAAALDLARHEREVPGPHVLVNSIGSGGALFAVVLRVDAAASA
jgi:3-oxoacyl-[acyl-carrier-protein] synthase II